MPVQARGIPYLLAGRNMMIQARTGSGKTAVYLLPMLERLDPNIDACQALILVPTRELARQVCQEAQTICAGTGLRSTAVYGGVGYGAQIDALRRGTQIVVGTPGRVIDHLLKGTLTLKRLSTLVYDEADHMLSMGFYPDMCDLQRYMPHHEIHTCMFSATFPESVMHTAEQFIRRPEFISLSSDHVHVTDTEHIFYVIPGMDKDRSLVRLIEIENPDSALIFCNTKARVRYITVVLQRFGYDADELSADLSQDQRERVLGRVRAGTLRFLVATDVAARGLDIPRLSHVFLFEPPEDVESYIHRAGRTGRAGAAGTAISLVNPVEKPAVKRIADHYQIDMQERPVPTDAEVSDIVAERLTVLLEASLRKRDKLQTERSRRFAPLAHTLVENEDELPIITMLLDDYYQRLLHAPVSRSDEAQASKPPKSSRPSRGRRGGRGQQRR
ncbi:MAG: DEAD/DEAH box helicase [Anaerolineae bacterium]|nr:DEAD/DEAH box helicase [Anaerolineae bacterium]